jgi:membrane protein implicated in regulation of membrane protease activity
MGAWAIWIIISVLFALFELLTPTFFFLWFAIGALLTAGLSLFVDSVIINVLFFIIVSFILWISTRKIASKLYKKSSPLKLFQDSLIGKEGFIVSKDSENRFIVKIEGEEWRAYIDDTSTSCDKGEKIVVTGKKGNILHIKKLD